jgi:hypothetical protein
MQLAEALMMNAVIATLGTALGLSSIFIGFTRRFWPNKDCNQRPKIRKRLYPATPSGL